jgi:1-deoxy-D-xylulose 5-phosphate reductoisomerase
LDRFISGDIAFLNMADLVEKTLEESSLINRIKSAPQNAVGILELDEITREFAKKLKF